jgi:predicted nucleic acid-binding protein
MGKIIVSDSSTLILMEKIDLLHLLTSRDRIIIPDHVYEEAVTKGISRKARDAYGIKNFVENKEIEVIPVVDQGKVKLLMKEFNLGKGETEAVALYHEQEADLVATDDHKGINLCRIEKIPFATAIAFVIDFASNHTVSIDTAKEMIRKLGKYGRYNTEIIMEALTILGDLK